MENIHWFIIYLIGFIPMAFLWAYEYTKLTEVDRPKGWKEIGIEILTYQLPWPILLPAGLLYHGAMKLSKRNKA